MQLAEFQEKLTPYLARRCMTPASIARALGFNLLKSRGGLNHRAPAEVMAKLEALEREGLIVWVPLRQGYVLADPAEAALRRSLIDSIRYTLATELTISGTRLEAELGTLALTVAENLPDVSVRRIGDGIFFELKQEVAA